MRERNYTLKVVPSEHLITGTVDGHELKLDKISKTLYTLQHQNTLYRRKYIAYNDTVKGTSQHLGIYELAEKFGVHVSTIQCDIRIIANKGIVGGKHMRKNS